MEELKNCIYPRVLYKEEPPETLLEDLVPPPELHLFIGIVTLFVKVFLALWPNFETWLKDHYIMFRGYQGVGLDGNNSNRFLTYLDQLELDLLSAIQLEPKYQALLSVVHCLRLFDKIKEKAFGFFKGPDLDENVNLFKNSFKELQVTLKNEFKYELNVSWKVHIVVNHLVPFLNNVPHGLGVYCEQAGESAHHCHKEVWQRYKRRMDHGDYGAQLKKSVVEFGAKNLK